MTESVIWRTGIPFAEKRLLGGGEQASDWKLELIQEKDAPLHSKLME